VLRTCGFRSGVWPAGAVITGCLRLPQELLAPNPGWKARHRRLSRDQQVSEYVSRARVIGITWPIPPEITDAELERRLFTPAGFHEGSTKPLPDWTKVHEELKRRGVTLPATPNSYSLLVESADVTSSVNTLKPASMHGPKEVTIATSVASRPRAINIRPMRGVLWRASNVYQRPPR
jgi:hypothetical protein